MLTPCSPCVCFGAPCEQCMFGYKSDQSNHEAMKTLIIGYLNGRRDPGYRCAERYMELHKNWKEQMGEYERSEFIMISAAEARQKVKDNREKMIDCELRLVESRIMQACEELRDSTVVNCILMCETINKLHELGYDVAATTDRNEVCYTISWHGNRQED